MANIQKPGWLCDLVWKFCGGFLYIRLNVSGYGILGRLLFSGCMLAKKIKKSEREIFIRLGEASSLRIFVGFVRLPKCLVCLP
ncbi:MAG: hypothetical protein HWD63_03865 [Candidatus Parvibacillus calidus]|nr:MAG: hypothetical protein HWD63_03865 [Candidatus Parvibacillus calidus]